MSCCDEDDVDIVEIIADDDEVVDEIVDEIDIVEEIVVGNDVIDSIISENELSEVAVKDDEVICDVKVNICDIVHNDIMEDDINGKNGKMVGQDKENKKDLTTQKNDMMWVDKYKPTKVSEIIGNESTISDIIEWLDKFKKKDKTIKRAILLAGDPGTGKTTCARLVAEECGFVVHEFNASDQRSKKSLQTIMLELAKSTDVFEFFMAGPKTKPKRHVIVMEEVDGMASGDYGGISELTNIVNPKNRDSKTSWLSPIICTTNMDKISKLKNLMRHCHLFNFEYPSYENMKTLFDKVVKNERLKISEVSCKKLIEHAQQDYRRMLYLMETLCVPLLNKTNNEIETCVSDDEVENMLSTFGNKYKSLGIDLAMDELLTYLEPPYSRLNIDRVTDICNMDYYIIPASVHENYPLWFPKKRKKKLKITNECDSVGNDYSDLIDIDDTSFVFEPNEFLMGNTNTVKHEKASESKEMLKCVKLIIDNISNKDSQYPLNCASTYESSVQDDMGLFTVGFPISIMKNYIKSTKTKKANLKLVYPKQFSNVVSLTAQMKVFKELRILLPHTSGRDCLLYFKKMITKMILTEDYDNLVKVLYDINLLPEQVPILMRVRMVDEDHSQTKKNWTLKIQNQIEKLFKSYNDEMFDKYRLQPIDVIQDSKRTITYECG